MNKMINLIKLFIRVFIYTIFTIILFPTVILDWAFSDSTLKESYNNILKHGENDPW